jgi:CBS domain-containing protein
MNSVRDYMTTRIVVCSRSATLLDVQERLSNQRVSRIVVVDTNGDPIGIISEKDVMRFILTDNSRRGLEEMRAHEVMSPSLISIKLNAPMAEAAEVMIRGNISSLAVNSNRFEGIVTKGDVVNYLGLTKRRSHSVGQFMTPHPITVKPSQSIFSTIASMTQNKISRVVVVDQNQMVQGIITLADFTLLLGYSLINLSKKLTVTDARAPAADFLKRAEAIGLTAKDFMTHDPFTIGQTFDLAEAARLMMKHGISGLPVTDNSTRLIGIVSKTDITQAVAYERKANQTQPNLLRHSPQAIIRVRPRFLS